MRIFRPLAITAAVATMVAAAPLLAMSASADTIQLTGSGSIPASITPTTTTLAANPATATVGVSDMLTATESPATAGAVDFMDGATDLGTAQVNASGVATLAHTFTTEGSHSLTATFTPTDTTNFSGSTGNLSLIVAPPWEPDVNANGTMSFFNSAGQQVTSGSDLTHLFDFAEASTTDALMGTKATLLFAAPVPNQPTGNYTTAIVSQSTTFPNASAPPPLNTSPNPVVTVATGDANLEAFIQANAQQTAPNFANVYQLRLVTSGAGGVGSIGAGTYWTADVLVNPTTGTWQEIYPQQGSTTATTTTTLAASPSGSAQQGSPVTLTATEVASDSTHPAGTVDFTQDGSDLGSAPVDSSGVATLMTSALLPSAPNGTQLQAKFTPTNTSQYTPSMSANLAYTVNPVAVTPTLSGPHQVGAKETCTEGTGPLDFGVTASYTWLANGVSIGTGRTLVVPASAYKKALKCTVSVHDGTGPSSSATSTSVTVIIGAALRNTKRPTLSGLHRVGRLETVHPGTWSKKGATFTYQWLLNGRVIRGATHTTLRLTRAERGKKISCRVTAHLFGYRNGVATTAAVRVTS